MNQLISSVCDEFKLDWQKGTPKSIESVLQECNSDERNALLGELLKLEISLRRAAGEQPEVADYAERFPEHLYAIRSAISNASTLDEETMDLKTVQDVSTTLPFIAHENDPKFLRHQDTESKKPRKLIGRYTILGELGRGGQADVFRGIHPTLPIEVAIKLTHTTLSDRAREALQEEAHILCELDHPHIARIRDFDFDAGRPFMVLDFIRGRSLGQIAQSQPPSPEQAAAMVAKIARAIGYAHARGVIHRDLKPDNVVIDESGQPKIIDFGMSRMRSGIAGATSETDEVSGTLAYMAPEQAIGITSDTDHRVDIFALGAILYRLLVGKAPYPNPLLPSMSMYNVVRQGRWDTTSLEQSLAPEPLQAICRQAMSLTPNERFATAEAMAAALETYLPSNTDQSDSTDKVPEVPQTLFVNDKRPFVISATGLGCVVSLSIGLSMFFILPGYQLFMSGTVRQEGYPYPSTNSQIPSPAVEIAGLNTALGTSTDQTTGLIRRFEVVQIGNADDRAEFSGSLLQYRPPRENDDIHVRAEFREPVYCYLVALNPDGVKQLCYPADSKVAQPEPIKTLRYPADEDSAFGLTDGTGQQAFVLYTSREPLPPFNDWDSDLKKASWPYPDVAGNWLYHEGQLEAIGPMKNNAADATRGTERKTKTPTPFKQMCDRMRQDGATDVSGVLFEVQLKP